MMDNYLLVSNNDQLFYLVDRVKNPRGVVIMCHGFSNHLGEYEVYAKALNKRGYTVYRYDMRGHGKTMSELGDIDTYQTYIYDLHTIVRMALRENVHVPLFTLGFSMGGLVSALFGIEYPNTLSGQVMIGPAVGYPRAINPRLKVLMNGLNMLAEDSLLHFKDGVIEFNSPKEKAELELKYHMRAENPMRTEYFTVRFLKTIFVDATSEVLRTMHSYRYPCYIAHGADDHTIPVAVSQHFYDTIASKDKELKVYEGMGHVLYNEPNGKQVIQDSIDWLDDRTTKK